MTVRSESPSPLEAAAEELAAAQIAFDQAADELKSFEARAAEAEAILLAERNGRPVDPSAVREALNFRISATATRAALSEAYGAAKRKLAAAEHRWQSLLPQERRPQHPRVVALEGT